MSTKKYTSLNNLQTFLDNLKNMFVKKSEVDTLELITTDDIDNICGATIEVATVSEVKF